ncbi:unnamed protein product [Cochlearia groenlandica]
MALPTEASDDLKKLIVDHITAVLQHILPQQISQHLNLEREQQAKKTTVVTSESESEHTPTPSEANRLAKGKGIAGTSKFRAIRNVYPAGTRKNQTVRDFLNLGADEINGQVPRHRVHQEPSEHEQTAPRRRGHAGHRRRTETIAGQRIYVDSDDEHYSHSDRSRRSRRPERRDRDDPRDPERQQLKQIKAKFPLFHGKNDSEAYLDWERKMESSFLCHDTYASNKVKIAI